MKKIIVAFVLIFSFLTKDVLASNIPGVQTLIQINPRVSLANDHFLLYTYRVLLGRDPDPGGINTFIPMLENGTSRKDIFAAVFNSGEFRNDPSFTDKTEYVKRLYLTILKREADSTGLTDHAGTLRNISDPNSLDSWYDKFNMFLYSPEYKVNNCQTGYYTYQQPLQTNAPTLADLFDGKAHFQPVSEAQTIDLQFNPSHVASYWDNKLPIIFNPDDGKYYAFTRAIDSSMNRWNMYMMKSTDGLNFTEVAPIFNQSVIGQLGDMYDGHIAIDHSVCPTRYVMAIECSGQMCVSYSTSPFVPSSWSKPKVIVHFILDSKNGHSTNKESASTGVFLIDGNNKYVSWTVLAGGPIDGSWGVNPSDGVFKKLRDMGTESTYSRATATSDFLTDLGSSNIGNIVLPAEMNTYCTSSWDCNNRDKQDWKKEGNYYYLMYNGANYYGCVRFPGDNASNVWSLGIVRSTNPLSGYDLSGVGEIITAEQNGCAASYSIINQIHGELYMYYAFIKNGLNRSFRSKLVWNFSPTPLPGDLNYDNKVDIFDYNLLIGNFGRTRAQGFLPPTIDPDIVKNDVVDIFDYNILVGNFGR